VENFQVIVSQVPVLKVRFLGLQRQAYIAAETMRSYTEVYVRSGSCA
jgi:hypothetical protein